MKKFFFSIVLLLCSSCFFSNDKGDFKRPIVLVTVAPYAFFVEKIAADTVDVQVLIPPATNAHIFEATPNQMQKISHTKIWFTIGEPLEKKVYAALKENNPALSQVSLMEGIKLLSFSQDSLDIASCQAHDLHHHHGIEDKDTHVWLNPKLAKIQVQIIADHLIALFPNHEEMYLKNLNSLLDELDDLDKEIKLILEPDQGKAILVSHPAFGYFCEEYSLRQLSIECEGKEPRPKDITHILQSAKALDVQVVFAIQGYSNKGAELIAEELHLPLHLVDPYLKEYFKNLKYIATLIRNP